MIVVIVGADGRKWTKPQEIKARNLIYHILGSFKYSKEKIIGDVSFLPNGEVDARLELVEYDSLTIVTSRDPVGEEKYYCLDCLDYISDMRIEAHQINNSGGIIKVHSDGGISTWVEITTATLGINQKIFSPLCTDPDRLGYTLKQCKNYRGYHQWENHFKPRSIKMAEFGLLEKEPYILYNIVPAKSCRWCDGTGWDLKKRQEEGPFSFPRCKKCGGDGAYSDGTYTYNHAKKLNREVIKIVID